MLYIKNANLVLENGILWDAAILLDGDRIAAFGKAAEVEAPAGSDLLDAKGLYVGPGFVDIHVHGGGGHMFTDEPEQAALHFLEHGETTILPTLYYDLSKEGFLESIKRIREVMDTTQAGKAIAGFYMEGPYMNPKYGAMAEQNKWQGEIRKEDYKEIVDAAGSLTKVWAVAPEREGLAPFLDYAREVNPDVIFSVGHSEAAPEQIQSMKRYGFTLQTHCMDATGRADACPGTRACGPDEYCMTDTDMYAEIICDSMGIHVNPAMLRMILHIKGYDKIILITDSFVSQMEAPKELRHVADLVFDSSGGLSGSKLTMDVACRNIMTHTNCGIAQAFLMASKNPAKVLGMEHEIGTVEVGKRANLVLVDHMFHVNTVILGGQIWAQS